MQNIAAHRLSELIGNIYDCAIEPDLWPEAMREICVELRCTGSVIILADLQQSAPRFLRSWNYDAETILRDKGYKEDVMFYIRQIAAISLPVDQPVATSQILKHLPMYGTRYDQEVAKPRQEVDSLQTVVMRDKSRLGLFAAIRHENVGDATDYDLALLRMFAPHIRRAITISDLVDLKTLEADALAQTLDRLAVGIVMVADENRILHANEAARQMFSEGAAVVSRKGRLSVVDTGAHQELTRAIEIARRDEGTIGGAGLAVSIGSRQAEPVVAHVLPLTHGNIRTRLMPQATAAVFISSPGTRLQFDFEGLARAYRLTPAEIRVCEKLTAGHTPNDIAALLGVSLATVKTHVARIFSKTGVSRQSALVALVHRFAPPIRAPSA